MQKIEIMGFVYGGIQQLTNQNAPIILIDNLINNTPYLCRQKCNIYACYAINLSNILSNN